MADANSSSSNIEQYISLKNYDIASDKIQKLDAMINAITGEGFANFQAMTDDAQQWYLQAVSEYSRVIKSAILEEYDESEASHA